MREEYRPVDCGLHSEYELLAMHGSEIRLSYVSEQGEMLQEEGRVVDVLTRDKAEYLVLSHQARTPLEVRLDRISGFSLLQQ